jgi:hypothetical protein
MSMFTMNAALMLSTSSSHELSKSTRTFYLPIASFRLPYSSSHERRASARDEKHVHGKLTIGDVSSLTKPRISRNLILKTKTNHKAKTGVKVCTGRLLSGEVKCFLWIRQFHILMQWCYVVHKSVIAASEM